ncbi:MAG: type II secretion system protein N [Gammaproteobacteria bacterium]|jgi:general secretion pathway protein N
MRTRHYILTGVVAYFVFLVATLPAAPVIDLFRDRLPVTINNISGSLWSGQASIIITNKLILNNAHWSFLPSRLLLAKVAIDVEADLNDNPLNTRLSVGLNGNLIVDGLTTTLGAAELASVVVLPLGELSGGFQLQINKATFQPGTVPRVDGTLDWYQAAVTVVETAELGNVSILMNGNDTSPLTASINNTGGQLILNGGLTTDETGQYMLKLTMKPNASATDNLINSLAMFAKKQRDGAFMLVNNGNLKQLGLM